MTGVLFVCTGNTCRSPTAEGVLRHLLDWRRQSDLVEIGSAGTHANRVGQAPDTRAQQVASEHGIDLSGIRARRIVADDFARFDFLIAMDRGNLAVLESMRPTDATCRLDLMLRFAPDEDRDEVPDPYHGEPEDYRTAFDLIRRAAEGLLGEIGPPHP